jgi:glutathione S-transferase
MLTIRFRLCQVLADETFPKWLSIFDSQLESNGSGFLVGTSMTVADLKLFCILDNLKSGILDGIPPAITEPYAKLQKLYDTVAKHEKVAAYRETTYPPK